MKKVIIHTATFGAYHHLTAIAANIRGGCWLMFPERQGGEDDCIRALMAMLHDVDEVRVITAYSHLLNFVGGCVELGFLQGEVHLHHPNQPQTAHMYDSDGCLTDWPLGCLHASYSHTHELQLSLASQR